MQFQNGFGVGSVADCTFEDWATGNGQYYGIQVIDTVGSGSGPITINRCTFTKSTNFNTTEATAIWCDQQGIITEIKDCIIGTTGTGTLIGAPIAIWRPAAAFTGCEISGNHITNPGVDGIHTNEMRYNSPGAMTIVVKNNYIENASAEDPADAGAIRISGFTSSDNVTVAYNVINGTHDGTYTHPGIKIKGSDNIKVYNNTIYGCDDGISLEAEGGDNSIGMDIRNNISAGNRGYGIKVNTSQTVTTFTNNCFYNNTSGNYSGISAGTGDVTTNPLFTNAGTGDFTLQVGSPCIDAGVNVSLTADYLGNSIVGNPDIGAYESNYIFYTLTAAPGSYAITGTAATLLNTHILSAAAGSYAQTGTAAGLYHGYYLSAASGSYGIAATNVTLLRSRVVSAAPGDYTITGTDAATLYKRIMAAATEAYALTGTDASLLFGRLVGASPGAMTITGTAAALLATRLLSPDPGSYAVTAPAAGTYYGRLVVASPDSYVITPVSVDLIYTPAQNPLTYTLTADPGGYALTGIDARVLFGRVLTGSVGGYGLTGTDIAALKTWLLHASPDSYVVTGTNVKLIYSGFSTNVGKKMSIEIDIAL